MPTVILPITDMTHHRTTDPDTNYGGSTQAYFRLNTYETYFKLPTGSVPAGKYIVSAIATVRPSSSVTNNYNFPVNEITEDWEYTTLTYNNRPTTGGLTTTLPYVYNTDIDIELTEIFKSQYDGGIDYGVHVFGGDSSSTNRFIYTNNETTEAYKPYITVIYSDFAPVVPSPTFPVNVSIDRSEDLTLRWSGPTHNEATLVWNDGSDHTVVIPGNAFEYTISGGTINAGTVSWKVKQSYTDVGYSEYSADVFFTAANKPTTPVINETTVTTKLPTFTWTQTGQTVFNFVVEEAGKEIVNHTGYTTTASYTLTKELDDNTEYVFKVRYQDSNALWSDFGTRTITTNFPKPGTPTAVIAPDVYYALITVTNGVNTSHNELLKLVDGVYQTVGTIAEDGNIDYYGLRSGIQETLKIRAFSPEGGYVDSITYNVTLDFPDSHIATVDGSLSMPLKFTPVYNIETEKQTFLLNYQGRTKPVAISGEDDFRNLRFSFELFTQTEVDSLLAFRGKKVILRNSRGFIITGVIPGFVETYRTNSTIVASKSFIEVAE